MNFNKTMVEPYLRAWARFIRCDRSVKQYSKVNIMELIVIGESPVAIEDKQLERVISAMQFMRDRLHATYRVLYVIYVDDISVKLAAKRLNLSRRQVSDYQLDGIIFLSGILFGAVLAESPPNGEIRRWGDYPKGSVLID